MPFPRVSPEKRSPKTRPHRSQGYLRLREIQGILWNHLISPDVTPSDFKQLAHAWCKMEDLKRNMKMIPRFKGINQSAIALVRRLRRFQGQAKEIARPGQSAAAAT
jgi:hypothetical protein